MATVATEIDQAGRGHGGTNLIGEGEGQIIGGCTIHVNGVQRGVGAFHLQLGVLRHEKNVGNVAAMVLIQVAPLLGQFDRFSGGNIFQIDDGAGDAALWTDDEAFEAGSLLAVRIADFRIFGYEKVKRAGCWGAGPDHLTVPEIDPPSVTETTL